MLSLLLALFACKTTTPVDSGSPPTEPVYWPGEDVRPSLDHSFFAEHTLPELSLYAHCEAEEDRLDAAHRGPLAVGNGRVFGLLGLGSPLNRLHSMTGPTYEKGTRFFGDHWFTLEVDGAELAFDRECIARPRGTAVVLTRAEAGDVTLYTVDFAPRPASGDRPATIVRHLLVSSASSHDIRLLHHAWQEVELEAGGLVERVADERKLAVWGTDPDGVVDLGAVHGDASATVHFEFAEAADELTGTEPQPTWLDETLAWWTDWSATGMQLHSEDPRVEDLYDSLRTTLKVQTTSAGGISVMSRYTGVWLRDTIGPVRFLLRAGLHEDAQAALDYLHLCHAVNGDYGNACTSGIDPDVTVEEPDWAAMGEFSGRTAAEGPSYVPLAWLDAAAWTDDDSGLERRWDYLVRGLRGQVMDEEGRQSFSGDETFRLLMNVPLGLDLEYPWHEVAWSANTSMLMRASATRLGAAAAALGHAEDGALLQERAALADNALQQHFLQDGGWFAPFIFHSDEGDNRAGDIAPQPFEDVNLKLLWSGALSVDDPLALSDLQTLQALAGRDDGTVQSPAHDRYAGTELYGVEIEDGVCTGMVPGYYLSTLTAIGDPSAEGAFDALHRYASPTGSFAEALLYDDLSALQVYYDETGGIGDIAARFRPWEGAIDLDAMLAFLFGAEPVDGGARFRPHLPGGQTRLEGTDLRVGACVGDLLVTGTASSRTVRFTAESSCQVSFELPVGDTPRELDGGELRTLPAGELLVRFAPRAVEAGQSLSQTVAW